MSISNTARKIPGVAAVEGAVTGALATEEDLPIKQVRRADGRGHQRQAQGLQPARAAHGRRLRGQAPEPRHDHRQDRES